MRTIIEIRRKVHREQFGKRLALLLLCAVMVISVVPVSVWAGFEDYDDAIPDSAVGGGRKLNPGSATVHKDNAYVFRILFGSHVTDQILYYSIGYQSTDGEMHTQLVFPNYGEFHEEGLKLAAINDTDEIYNSGFGYRANNFSEADNTQILKTVEYYFEAEYPLEKVTYIDAFARYDASATNGNSINIQEMRVFKVDELYGVGMVGGLSDEYYIKFYGECLCYATFQNALAWSSTDTLFRIDGRSSNPNKLIQMETRTPYDSINSSELYFELTFADLYGCGIESNMVPYGKLGTSMKQINFPELLTLSVRYTDIYGHERSADIPVTMATLMTASRVTTIIDDKTLSYAEEESIYSEKIHGIMQQGETVVFAARLPDFQVMKSATFSFGLDIAVGTAKLKEELTHTWDKEQEKGNLSFVSFKAYDASKSTLTTKVTDYQLVSTVDGTPICCSTALSYKGITVTADTTTSISLTNMTGNQKIRNPVPGFNYLFSFITDTPAAAGTEDEIFCEIHYHALDGTTKTYGPVSLKTSTQDYYGYWPGTSDDISYQLGAEPGGTLCIALGLNDVDYFTGVTVYMDASSNDDWQVKEIHVEALKTYAARSMEEVNLYNADGTALSDRKYTRKNKTIDISPTLENPVLLQSKTRKTISFTVEGSSVEESDVDWSDKRFSMDYENASQYLGFEKTRQTFTVAVDVAGDIVSDVLNEGCGSKNKFYFQLIFEEGVSAYVLANQQLTSDGFIAGETATFSISTNQDYGSVTAVRLIPDDISENNEAFDKLKIKRISVIKQSDEGLSMTWVADLGDGKWIDIDYHDEGERNSAYGQKTRKESELAQTFLITERGYTMNALVTVSTKDFENSPLSGQVMCEIHYTNASGEEKVAEVNMVKAINDYAKKSTENMTYTPANNAATFDAPKMDSNFMLRANKTDRFIVSLENAVSLNSVKFTVRSVVSGTWRIQNVAVYQIISPGVIVLNAESEYQSTAKTQVICSSAATETAYELWYDAEGHGAAKEILFSDNKLDVDIYTGSWKSAITYVPTSKDDTLNIYAYLSDSLNKPSTYDLKASVKYSVITATATDSAGEETTKNDSYFYAAAKMDGDDDRNVFSVTGVKVSGINNLCSLTLKTDSYNSEMACVDHVVVEHVRSGVIIGTYYFDFKGRDAEYGCESTPVSRSRLEIEQQILTFMVSDDSGLNLIEKDTSDIAIRLNYTSSNEDSGTEYASPYKFLSDTDLNSVHPGEVIQLAFEQDYVKDITGVTFAAVGSAAKQVLIQCAMVETADVERTLDAVTSTYVETGRTVKNAYSFGIAKTSPVSLSPSTMILSGSTSETLNQKSETMDRQVALLQFKFVTATSGDTYEAGTSGPVRMTLVYDHGSVTYTDVYDDLDIWTTSGDFTAGATATVTMMLPAYDSIRSIELTPYVEGDSTKTASWKLASMELDITTRGKTEVLQRFNLNKTAYSDTPLKIGLANIVLKVSAYIGTTGVTAKTNRNYRSGDSDENTEAILLNKDQTIQFEPAIEGSLEDISVFCRKIAQTENGKLAREDAPAMITSVEQFGILESVIFTPTDATGDYQVIFSSKENSGVYIIIDISVRDGQEQEEPADNPEEDEPSDTPTEDDPEDKPADEPTEDDPTGETEQEQPGGNE